MIENVSTQLTVFHCFAHCLLPGRAFASLYALLFLEKEAEIGGRDLLQLNLRHFTSIFLGYDRSVRNKQLPTCPPQVEFAGGKLSVSEGCPLDSLKF